MADACHEGLIAKFDQLITKLQTRIMKKERLQVSENGTYTAPENTGYTVVDVNVAASAPANLQPMKTVTIENPTEGFMGIKVTPDEGYDGLESVRCFAPTSVLDAEENVTYNAPPNKVGFHRVNVNVANVPNYIRGSGRINTKNKTISTTDTQSIMSVNVMEEDAIPLETEEQKREFLESTFLAYVTGIVDGNVPENPFSNSFLNADIELQDQNNTPLYSYSKISFIKKEHHEIALTANNVTSGFEMVTFFQRKVERCVTKAEVNDSRVVKAVLKKIYCEVTPKSAFLPIVLKEGTYCYVSVISPSLAVADE